MQEKIEFELHLCLVSTESWVVSPKHLALWNGGIYIIYIDCCMYSLNISTSTGMYVRTSLVPMLSLCMTFDPPEKEGRAWSKMSCE